MVRSVLFASFPTDKSLCVTTTLALEVYLTKTSLPCRTLSPSEPNQLFLSYHRSYKPVQSCSIAQWIKTFIGCTVTDTDNFKAHSTRSASTSKGRNVGISVADIQNMADFSTASSTFRRFYYRPTHSTSYINGVLSHAQET